MMDEEEYEEIHRPPAVVLPIYHGVEEEEKEEEEEEYEAVQRPVPVKLDDVPPLPKRASTFSGADSLTNAGPALPPPRAGSMVLPRNQFGFDNNQGAQSSTDENIGDHNQKMFQQKDGRETLQAAAGFAGSERRGVELGTGLFGIGLAEPVPRTIDTLLELRLAVPKEVVCFFSFVAWCVIAADSPGHEFIDGMSGLLAMFIILWLIEGCLLGCYFMFGYGAMVSGFAGLGLPEQLSYWSLEFLIHAFWSFSLFIAACVAAAGLAEIPDIFGGLGGYRFAVAMGFLLQVPLGWQMFFLFLKHQEELDSNAFGRSDGSSNKNERSPSSKVTHTAGVVDGICKYVSNDGLSCNMRATSGDFFCVNHTCSVGGCTNSKPSSAQFCTEHAGNVDLYGRAGPNLATHSIPEPVGGNTGDYDSLTMEQLSHAEEFDGFDDEEDMRAVSEPVKCKFKSETGRACKNFGIQGNPFCTQHTCPYPGCGQGKSSKQPYCQQHM